MSSTSSIRVDRVLSTALPLVVPHAEIPSRRLPLNTASLGCRQRIRLLNSVCGQIQKFAQRCVVIIRIMEVSKCVPSDDVNLTMAMFGEEVVIKQVEQEVSELLSSPLLVAARTWLL